MKTNTSIVQVSHSTSVLLFFSFLQCFSVDLLRLTVSNCVSKACCWSCWVFFQKLESMRRLRTDVWEVFPYHILQVRRFE